MERGRFDSEDVQFHFSGVKLVQKSVQFNVKSDQLDLASVQLDVKMAYILHEFVLRPYGYYFLIEVVFSDITA